MLFFNVAACPAGSTALASANQGRVFVGESGTSGAGAQNSVASVAGGVEPTHTHAGDSSMCLQGVTKVGSGVCKITLGSNGYLGTSSVCNSNERGRCDDECDDGLREHATAGVHLDGDVLGADQAVVLMNPGSSAGDASRATSCSAGGSGGMASWTPGVGRSLVAADALKVATSPYYVQSSGTSRARALLV
jgi:hypothetical protein